MMPAIRRRFIIAFRSSFAGLLPVQCPKSNFHRICFFTDGKRSSGTLSVTATVECSANWMLEKPSPLHVANLAFKDRLLHPHAVILTCLGHTAQSPPSGRFDRGYIVGYQHAHDFSLFTWAPAEDSSGGLRASAVPGYGPAQMAFAPDGDSDPATDASACPACVPDTL